MPKYHSQTGTYAQETEEEIVMWSDYSNSAWEQEVAEELEILEVK